MKIKKILIIVLLILSMNSILNGQTVKIGKQLWTVKNLNVSTFKNGDSIPQAKTFKEKEAFTLAGKAFWCYYDFNPQNENIYGKLYNDIAVNDPRGLAPEGFHIPTANEWTILVDYLGGEKIAFLKLSSKMGWKSRKKGKNLSGFSALPGGHGASKSFDGINYFGCWWSITKDISDSGSVQDLYGGKEIWQYYFYLFGIHKEVKISSNFSTTRVNSVRCIKD